MISRTRIQLILTALHERLLFLLKGDYQNILLAKRRLKNYCFMDNTTEDAVSTLNTIFEKKCSLGQGINPTGNDDRRVFLFQEDFVEYEELVNLKATFSKSFQFMSALKLELGFIMINETIATEDGNGSGGGWHRDSAYGQLKVMIYLNDVVKSNGAFQIVKDSRVFSSKLKYDSYINKSSPLRLYNNVVLEREAFTITGQSGTTIAFNPENIHRGSPCLNGQRRAATFYFFPRSRLQKMISEFRIDIDRLKINDRRG
jgi:hypothetical protein